MLSGGAGVPAGVTEKVERCGTSKMGQNPAAGWRGTWRGCVASR